MHNHAYNVCAYGVDIIMHVVSMLQLYVMIQHEVIQSHIFLIQSQTADGKTNKLPHQRM